MTRPGQEARTTAGLQTLPGTDALGHGYDAAAEYGSPSSVRAPIYDFGPFDQQVAGRNGIDYLAPKGVEVIDVDEGSFDVVKGDSLDEYRQSYASKTGISAEYGAFSGSLTVEYSAEERSSLASSYVTVRHMFDAWRVLFQPDQMPLLAAARADLDGAMTPEQVVAAYGTHVLVDLVVGGRANYTASVDTRRWSSQKSLEVVAEAAYESAIGKFDASHSEATQSDITAFQEVSRTRITTQGGDFDEPFDPTHYDAWMSAFKQHPVLVDLLPTSFVPLASLVKDPARAAAIQAAVDKHVADAASLVVPEIPAVKVRLMRNPVFVHRDDGSGAHEDIAVYVPPLGRGECWVGHHIYTPDMDPYAVAVTELVPGALAPPLRYECVWAGGRHSTYALWRIIPPPDYRAVGAYFGAGTNDPSQDPQTATLRCLHKSLTVPGGPMDMSEWGYAHGAFWTDEGSGSSGDGSAWYIQDADGGPPGMWALTFAVQAGYEPPADGLYEIASPDHSKRILLDDET
jgi:hypothetical protein